LVLNSGFSTIKRAIVDFALEFKYAHTETFANLMVSSIPNKWDNVEAIKILPCHVVIIHGDKNTHIPPKHAQALNDAVTIGTSYMKIIPDVDHEGSDLYNTKYLQRLFLAVHTFAKSTPINIPTVPPLLPPPFELSLSRSLSIGAS